MTETTTMRSTRPELDPDTVRLIQSMAGDTGQAINSIREVLLRIHVPEVLTADTLTASDSGASPRAIAIAKIVTTVNEQTLALERICQILIALLAVDERVRRRV